MQPADFRYAAFTLVLRLMQLNYASGFLGLLIALLWIPSLWILHPILSRPEIPRELQIIIPGLLSSTVTCLYFWRADLIKLHRWKTEKVLILATAFMFIGNVGLTVFISPQTDVVSGEASQSFPALLLALIFYGLGALFGVRVSRWWHTARIFLTLMVLSFIGYVTAVILGPGIMYLLGLT